MRSTLLCLAMTLAIFTNTARADYLTIISEDVGYLDNAPLGSEVGRATGDFARTYATTSIITDPKGAKFARIQHEKHGAVYVPLLPSKVITTERGKGNHAIESLRVGRSDLRKKALIKNDPKRRQLETTVEFKTNSDGSGRTLSEAHLFEVRFIYAESDNAILVGDDKFFTMDTASDVLSGWIPSGLYAEWNSRESLELRPLPLSGDACEKTAYFYETPELAVRNSKNEVGIDYQEDLGNEPFPYHLSRYPLLETKSVGSRSDEVFELLYIGSALTASGGKVSHRDVGGTIHGLKEALKSRETEVAILLDATAGMQQHIESVKGALGRFLEQSVKTDGSAGARLAIAVYRDWSDRYQPHPEFKVEHQFEELRRGTLQGVVDSVNGIVATSHQDTIPDCMFPEAMFNGISRAINDPKMVWRSGRNKYLIVLGDHGNHRAGGACNEKNYTAEQITNLLNEEGVLLYGIQVPTRLDDDPERRRRKQNAADDFKTQLSIIQNSIFDEGKAPPIPLASGGTEESVLKALLDVQADDRSTREDLAKKLDPRRRARAKRNARQAGIFRSYSGRATKKLIERLQIKEEVLESDQLTGIVYSTADNACGEPRFETRILMARTRLIEIQASFLKLEDMLRIWSERRAYLVKNALRDLVQGFTGEFPGPGDSIKEFVEKRTGIPIRTKLLDKSVDRFMADMRDADKGEENRRAMIKHLNRANRLMHYYVTEQGLKKDDEPEWDPLKKKWNLETTGRTERHFFQLSKSMVLSGSDEIKDPLKAWVWAPIEIFP